MRRHLPFAVSSDRADDLVQAARAAVVAFAVPGHHPVARLIPDAVAAAAVALAVLGERQGDEGLYVRAASGLRALMVDRSGSGMQVERGIERRGRSRRTPADGIESRKRFS